MPKEIKITDLKPHPRNEEIYGSEDVSDLVAQIKERDKIIVPLIVNKDNVILAGHRRWKAAHKLNLKTVPCEVRAFNSPEDEIEFLLHDNVKRKKTKEQLAREGMALEEVLSVQAEGRRQATLKQNQSDRDDSSLSDSEDGKDTPNDTATGRVRDEVAKALKIGSGKQYDHMKAVIKRADELREIQKIEEADLFVAILNRSPSAANDLLKVDLDSISVEDRTALKAGMKIPSSFLPPVEIKDKKKAKDKAKVNNASAMAHLTDIQRSIKQLKKLPSIKNESKSGQKMKEQIATQIQELQILLSAFESSDSTPEQKSNT
jgi:ParB family chromosome partitioning protein